MTDHYRPPNQLPHHHTDLEQLKQRLCPVAFEGIDAGAGGAAAAQLEAEHALRVAIALQTPDRPADPGPACRAAAAQGQTTGRHFTISSVIVLVLHTMLQKN